MSGPRRLLRPTVIMVRGQCYQASAGRPESLTVAARGRRVAVRERCGMAKNLAVISVIGHDQKGVVARISTYLAGCNINIEDIEQRVMEGLFIMTMLVDLSDLNVNLDELILGLKRI